MEKCRSLNKEERTDRPQPHAEAGERETRRWLYARRSVTQARWATAPSPRVATLRTGWPRDAQSRLALLRRKPEINAGRSLRAHWRESLCVFVASARAHFLLVVGISPLFLDRQSMRSFARITILWDRFSRVYVVNRISRFENNA